MCLMSFTYPAEYANSRFVNKTSASVSTIVSWSFKPDTQIITVAKEKLQRMAMRVNEGTVEK